MANNCEVHLQGSLFSLDESRAMIEKRLAEMSPDELTGTKNLQYRDIQLMVEDEITKKVQNVSDMLMIETQKRNVMVDSLTGKEYKNLSEVLTGLNNKLVGRNSIDTKRRTLKSHLVTKLDEFEAVFKTNENTRFKSLRDIVPDSKEEAELFMKVRNFQEEIDTTKLTPQTVKGMLDGADELDRLAYALVAHNAYTRKTLGQAGVATRFHKNFVMKRRYDWAKLEAMGEEGFVGFMSNHLDIEKTFGKVTPEDVNKSLKALYREFELSASSRTSVLDVGDLATSTRANALSRKLVYLDDGGMSEYAAFKELSVGGMRDQFEKNATNSAETAIKVSELGYNSNHVFESVIKHVEEKFGTKRSALDSFKESRIKSAYMEMSGQQNLVQTGLTTFSNTVRTALSVAYLGNALTSALLDPLDNMRQGFYVNGDLFGGLGDHISGMAKAIQTRFKSKEELNQIASELGVIYSYISNGEGMRLASGDMATTGGKVSDLVARHGGTAMNIATLLPMQTGLSKVASGMSAARQFSKLVDSPNFNKYQLDTLKEYKFSDMEIKALRSNMIERSATWADNIITPAGIRESLLSKNPEDVARLLGVDVMDAGKAVLDLSMKYETFINDWVVRGTPAPELATKTLLNKSDEVEARRVLRNLTTQFMDTPVAQLQNFSEMMDKVIRVNTQNGNFNKTGFTADMMQHVGAYIMAGVPLYLAADAAMSIATQRESVFDKFRNADNKGQAAIMAQVLGRTSVVPFALEVLENQFLSEYNKTAADTFSGSPALSYLNDSLKLAQALPSGDSEKIWKRTKRLLPSNALPVRAISNWSAQAGINPFHDGENLRGSGGNYGF